MNVINLRIQTYKLKVVCKHPWWLYQKCPQNYHACYLAFRKQVNGRFINKTGHGMWFLSLFFLEKILGSNSRNVRLEHELCLGRWIDLDNHIRELPFVFFLVFEHFGENFPVSMWSTHKEINLKSDKLTVYTKLQIVI